jgi:sugar/nucleoside kinase (ribokinase family)
MFDVCGAGDTFLAGLTYKILQGEPIGPCIEYANKCAGIAVQHRGTYTLKKQDIESL